jgi:hypothetical protein
VPVQQDSFVQLSCVFAGVQDDVLRQSRSMSSRNLAVIDVAAVSMDQIGA